MTTPHETIRQALISLKSDLESEIYERYRGTLDHPTMARRYERDLETTRNALHALELLDSHAVVPREGMGSKEWLFRQVRRVKRDGIISPEEAISILWMHPDNPYNQSAQEAQDE
jgi:hypothetical protein